MRKQQPPNCIKLGLCTGCNLACNYCGLQSIRAKPGGYQFMTVETAEHVASLIARAGWNSRFEIGLFGEETANPAFIEIVSIIRKHLPKNYIILMSNGLGFQKSPAETLYAALQAGVNVICLDAYEHVNIVPRIREKLSGGFGPLEGYAKFYEYPEQKDGNPHKRVMNERRIVFTKDPATATSGTHSYLHNYAGLGGPPDYSAAGRRCAKSFRELAIRHDGKVPLCCMDWRTELPLGDLMAIDDIEQIWQSSLFNAVRKKHYHGERDFGPCNGCGARSYRVGLLPDKMGQETLPKATGEDMELINRALDIPTGVRLPWEEQLPPERRVK